MSNEKSNLDRFRIFVLRLGHRPKRDKRVTTHVMLAARALGAVKVFYTGERDLKVEEKICEVTERWGGSFEVEYVNSWRSLIREWKDMGGEVIHLTMYGLPIQSVIDDIRNSPRDKLIVVGGAKVPSEVFKLADWNVSITQQPHSEVSALAIFLHELFMGKELERRFEGAKLKIIPQSRGKLVVREEQPNR